jgi:hypothetical protein
MVAATCSSHAPQTEKNVELQVCEENSRISKYHAFTQQAHKIKPKQHLLARIESYRITTVQNANGVLPRYGTA